MERREEEEEEREKLGIELEANHASQAASYISY